MFMQITRASDYAVRVMIHLAGLPRGSKLQQADLSKATDVSGHFLSKVLQRLVRAQLIRSQRGAGGGFALAVPADSISLLSVVEAMEGPLRLNLCLEDGPRCNRESWCPAHQVWVTAQAAIGKVLGAASIAALAMSVNAGKGSSYAQHRKAALAAATRHADPTPRPRRSHGP